ncbi:MAG TPA: RNA-binding protein [Xanthobacteraceae bacterium]|jgi:predicted RNA-binding protein YlxR (DUF448 family)|nr:RNA-binding protein [Xanthobacteraceae bacterium]
MTAADEIELDQGPRAQEVERLCVATREVRPVSDLIRFVIGPDGEAVPDLKRKLPGRGVWVTATEDVLGEAIKRKVFARGFKRDVRLPTDLLDRTGRLLGQAVLDALAIAAKAGSVVSGFAKVENALTRDHVMALLHAGEAAPDGVKKLDAALRRSSKGGAVAVVSTLTGLQLDLALGRPNVIHAALLAGPVSDTFLARLRRLERFRTGDLGTSQGTNAGTRIGKAARH